ncbi:hypothetical protein H4Q26_006165 [Puccinia striiformis f. sp. tritici PST-130]|nr:hypothetical protein H4Q26_006165 [Puccinia striiformis f. sp. tritici PST-130]
MTSTSKNSKVSDSTILDQFTIMVNSTINKDKKSASKPYSAEVVQLAKLLVPFTKLLRLFFIKFQTGMNAKQFPSFTQMTSDELYRLGDSVNRISADLTALPSFLGIPDTPFRAEITSPRIIRTVKHIESHFDNAFYSSIVTWFLRFPRQTALLLKTTSERGLVLGKFNSLLPFLILT